MMRFHGIRPLMVLFTIAAAGTIACSSNDSGQVIGGSSGSPTGGSNDGGAGVFSPGGTSGTIEGGTGNTAQGGTSGTIEGGTGNTAQGGTSGTIEGGTGNTADPNAWPQVGQLVRYLKQLPSKGSHRVVSGQYTTGAWIYNNPDGSDFQTIYNQSGQWPGIMGANFGLGRSTAGTCYQYDPSQSNWLFINYWKAGGLVELGDHFCNPVDNGGGNDMTRVDLTQLVTSGTPSNLTFTGYLDGVASAFQGLANAGVVVMYRPFLEMNGNWFWWNNYSNPAAFQSLWEYTFNYLTHTKGLHNIIWIWSPMANEGHYLSGFPAPDVDIVALDYYNPNGGGIPGVLGGYTELLATGKPFGLAEIGLENAAGGTTAKSQAPQDDSLIISSIKQYAPKATFFVQWSGLYSMEQNSNTSGLLNDSWVVNRPVR